MTTEQYCIGYEDGYSAGFEDGIKPASTPDCRTCDFYYTDDVGPACLKNGCTNGDKYQPAPKVVLWRTE